MKEFIIGLVSIISGAYVILWTRQGLREGELPLNPFTYKRSEHPWMFCFLAIRYSIGGPFLIVLGIIMVYLGLN